MRETSKLRYIVAAVVALMLFTFYALTCASIKCVHAATSAKEAYEKSNVWDNLQGSTIAGNAFNIEDYPYSENGKPQVISFVELGYSYYANKQADFGLYVYVYNPQQTALDTDTERNKIQFTYGNKANYSKYVLEFLNYSEEAGYEGRFWKFKIKLTDEQRSDMLQNLNETERVYKISGIELSQKSVVTEYDCGQTYTYKGFALGYGSELAASDTLTCTVDGYDKYLSLDVHDTFFRGKGTNGKKYIQDTLHSVYFSVPNKVIDEYGRMTSVHATWLNAYTTPMLVTGNSGYYETMLNHIAEEIGTPESSSDMSFKYLFRTSEELADMWIGGYHVTSYYCGYNYPSDMSANIARYITNLHWLFKAENGDADTYDVPSEDISDYMQRYTAVHGGELVNNRYSKALFESVDSAFTDINIHADETYSLTSEIIKQSWWEKLFGGSHVEDTEVFNNIKAIEPVDYNDIANLESVQVCNKYYVDDADYKEFSDFCKTAKGKNETVYLFRYKQSEYFSAEVYEGEIEYHHSWLAGKPSYYTIENDDTNAFLMQQWVQLDFDIIDLTFTNDNVETVIPVVMSPIDIITDGDHPVVTTPDGDSCDSFNWKLILGLIAAVFIFLLLSPILVPALGFIVKAVLWVICLPFKAIGAVFRTGKRRRAEKSERQLRREKKRRQRIRERKRRESGKLPDNVWTEDRNVKPNDKSVTDMSREEVESYLDSIDWTDPIWSDINGTNE